jgi:hypothetical protein
MPGDDLVVVADQDRIGKTKPLDAVGNLLIRFLECRAFL